MTASDAHPQKTRAIMFSDIKGYSRLKLDVRSVSLNRQRNVPAVGQLPQSR